MPNGVPSDLTFYRAFRVLRPDALEACLHLRVRSLAEPLDGRVVAFDGKAILGAMKRALLGVHLHPTSGPPSSGCSWRRRPCPGRPRR